MSVNITSFLKKETRFPKWVSVAFGYGASGMISGKQNVIVYSNGSTANNPINNQSEIISANGHIDYFYRYRKYYLSLDIDFTKIKINPNFYKVFLVFNGFKVPFPAVEFDKHGVNFKPFYF